jgi:small-conductance mechanosensitive channel
LLDFAYVTEGVSSGPPPFVLIRDLKNNYFVYEINAYTDKPNELAPYSALMTNILERFAEAHAEILPLRHIALRKSFPTIQRKRRTSGSSKNCSFAGKRISAQAKLLAHAAFVVRLESRGGETGG